MPIPTCSAVNDNILSSITDTPPPLRWLLRRLWLHLPRCDIREPLRRTSQLSIHLIALIEKVALVVDKTSVVELDGWQLALLAELNDPRSDVARPSPATNADNTTVIVPLGFWFARHMEELWPLLLTDRLADRRVWLDVTFRNERDMRAVLVPMGPMPTCKHIRVSSEYEVHVDLEAASNTNALSKSRVFPIEIIRRVHEVMEQVPTLIMNTNGHHDGGVRIVIHLPGLTFPTKELIWFVYAKDAVLDTIVPIRVGRARLMMHDHALFDVSGDYADTTARARHHYALDEYTAYTQCMGMASFAMSPTQFVQTGEAHFEFNARPLTLILEGLQPDRASTTAVNGLTPDEDMMAMQAVFAHVYAVGYNWISTHPDASKMHHQGLTTTY
jgi:hypothetical protein